MFQVRIHGRGGQGAVTAAELLSVAAFFEGRHAQAFPSFGSERTGAPVMAFCRIDDRPIRVREPVTRPDALVIQDATLLHQVNVVEGLTPGGSVLVNSPGDPDALGLTSLTGPVLTVPATAIALRHFGRPVPNVVLLGGLAALTGCVTIDSLADAVQGRFHGELGSANAAAAREAYAHIRARRRRQPTNPRGEPAHAQTD
ncbi:2-oxoacid:acceptor oxidoreductase family protein [Streptomyces ferrugineus]|uniref:2-oxoacid:acceptor oxidoreductase family protein n=1 Tax=Streptomyces ferrugineus TaxID=1413221 RepID=A0A7M2SE84_9ACTN|nr:2-oxoacid:acceptor oxidoreductase family protein [Streptomyces ferrugineus]QOV33733.1 2-oxoacid:acceptor oxidoreductase family protein [Streptomyces ferrugineus]